MNNLRLRSNFSHSNAWNDHIKKLRQSGKIPAPAAWMESTGDKSHGRRKQGSNHSDEDS